jgi:hypothetical protein
VSVKPGCRYGCPGQTADARLGRSSQSIDAPFYGVFGGGNGASLVVDLNQVHLTVTATQGGGVLGNLFCSLSTTTLPAPTTG